MAEHVLLEHFLRMTEATDHGVVCFGPTAVISNRTATRLLRGLDPISLCDRVAGEPARLGTLRLHRSAGRDIVVDCRSLELPGEQPGRMLLLRVAEPADSASPAGPTRPGLVGSSASWEETSQRVFDLAATEGHVLVTGERGVGKLRAALAIVSVRGLTPVIFDTSGVGALGTDVWLENVAASLHELAERSALIVARVERLEPEALESLVELLDRRPVPSLATAVRPERRGSAGDPLDCVGLFAGRLHIPALRHRPEDVELLARHFDARHGMGRLVWTAEALQVMQHYLWPGNLKELEQVVKDLLLRLPPTAEVHADVLPDDLRRSVRRGPLTRLGEAEVDVMLAALAEANGNKDLAAHLIGIHRATLYRKLQNYGLDWTPDT
jgi:transcriptional regulator with AAA-type ATPase domain